MLRGEKTINVDELLAKAEKPSADAMQLHPFYRGKVETALKCTVRHFNDFAIWYTPGVAAPCRAIAEDPQKVYDYTNKWNTVAVVSDGTRVLGLGDIGPEAAQFGDEVLVSPIDVMSVGDGGVAIGRQTGEHQRGAGPDVTSIDGTPAQATDAPDDHVLAFERHVGTHAVELTHIAEAGVVDVLRDHRGAGRHRQKRRYQMVTRQPVRPRHRNASGPDHRHRGNQEPVVCRLAVGRARPKLAYRIGKERPDCKDCDGRRSAYPHPEPAV